MSRLTLTAGDLLRIVAALELLAEKEERDARNSDNAVEATRLYAESDRTRELWTRVAGAV